MSNHQGGSGSGQGEKGNLSRCWSIDRHIKKANEHKLWPRTGTSGSSAPPSFMKQTCASVLKRRSFMTRNCLLRAACLKDTRTAGRIGGAALGAKPSRKKSSFRIRSQAVKKVKRKVSRQLSRKVSTKPELPDIAEGRASMGNSVGKAGLRRKRGTRKGRKGKKVGHRDGGGSLEGRDETTRSATPGAPNLSRSSPVLQRVEVTTPKDLTGEERTESPDVAVPSAPLYPALYPSPVPLPPPSASLQIEPIVPAEFPVEIGKEDAQDGDECGDLVEMECELLQDNPPMEFESWSRNKGKKIGKKGRKNKRVVGRLVRSGCRYRRVSIVIEEMYGQKPARQ